MLPFVCRTTKLQYHSTTVLQYDYCWLGWAGLAAALRHAQSTLAIMLINDQYCDIHFHRLTALSLAQPRLARTVDLLAGPFFLAPMKRWLHCNGLCASCWLAVGCRGCSTSQRLFLPLNQHTAQHTLHSAQSTEHNWLRAYSRSRLVLSFSRQSASVSRV